MTDDTAEAWRRHIIEQADALATATDRVFESHHGQPVPEVLAALRTEFDAIPVSITDAALTPYAEAISRGQRVSWKVE